MEETRLAEAKVVVQSLLDALETRSEPILQTLLKAKRLARLLRDTDAQTWLDYETGGYPDPFPMLQIGYCAKYMKASRFESDGTFKVAGLPTLESEIKAFEQHMAAVQLPKSVSSAQKRGPWELSDFTILVSNINQSQLSLRDSLVEDVNIFARARTGLHSYATDCQISLEFGEISTEIFERSRTAVSAFIRSTCPKAAEQLLGAFERLAAGDAEARAHCLTSCRRVLLTVADAVFPPQQEEYIDGTGKKRKVGTDEYKNRLLAFIDQKIRSGTDLSLLTSEIEHLSARLDAVYSKVCKGVHAEVSASEAELAVIHTYLFLAEVVRLSTPTNPQAE